MTAGWWREPEELDEEQLRVVGLPPDGRYLISGKPGSGKTNLLVLRGAYLIRAGYPDIKVLTWGRLISEFIASGGARHGLDSSQLVTFRTWGLDVLADAGVETELTGDYGQQITSLIRELQSALSDDELSACDAILLDEVQDYPSAALAIFRELAPRLFFAGDENQRIYGGRPTLAAYSAIVDEHIVLPYHYRNGRRICLVAEAINGETDYAATSRYDEETLPSRVYLHQASDLRAQVADQVIPALREALRTYPNELLGVMVPRNNHLAEVVEQLRESDLEEACQFQTRAEGNEPLSEEKPIIISTVHAAKGLEYRVAHVVGMEGIETFPRGKQRNVAYTAVTRAKTTLHGHYSDSIPGWLRSAFLRGEDARRTPDIREIF